jgi:hypothetical protein
MILTESILLRKSNHSQIIRNYFRAKGSSIRRKMMRVMSSITNYSRLIEGLTINIDNDQIKNNRGSTFGFASSKIKGGAANLLNEVEADFQTKIQYMEKKISNLQNNLESPDQPSRLLSIAINQKISRLTLAQ